MAEAKVAQAVQGALAEAKVARVKGQSWALASASTSPGLRSEVTPSPGPRTEVTQSPGLRAEVTQSPGPRAEVAL